MILLVLLLCVAMMSICDAFVVSWLNFGSRIGFSRQLLHNKYELLLSQYMPKLYMSDIMMDADGGFPEDNEESLPAVDPDSVDNADTEEEIDDEDEELDENDDELDNWIRETGETLYHPVGTCKMGIDELAVTNEHGQVHGIKSLRVVDASLMPSLIAGNTNAPTIMIAEKISDHINGKSFLSKEN